MGIFGKIKDLVGIEDVEEEITEEEIQAAVAKQERKTETAGNSFTAPRPEAARELKPAVPAKPALSNTVPFKLVVIDPKSFEECPRLVDNLKSKKPVIINLEKLDTDVARKIFDFLSGAAYALNGNVQKVANNIFVFAPENVDISSSVEHKGIEFNGGGKNPWR